MLIPNVKNFCFWSTSNPFSDLYHLFGGTCPIGWIKPPPLSKIKRKKK
jgi:hypothetical protein